MKMKKQFQAIISRILVLCMIMTLSASMLIGLPSVSAAATPITFEPNYNGSTTIPAGWEGSGFIVKQADWPAFVGNGYGGSCKLIYNSYIWEGEIDYSWKQLNGYNGTAVLYFYYNDENNYYALKMSASGSQIVKVVNGEETVLGSDSTALVNIGKDVSIRLTRTNNGVVTIYSGTSGSYPTTVLYTSNVADTASPTGKIGIGFLMGGGHIFGVKVIGNANDNTTPNPSPSSGAATNVTYAPNFMGVSGVPTGWNFKNFSIKDPATWGALLGEAYGTTGYAMYNGYIWEGSIDYTLKQLNGYNGTALMYFYYNDANNYYALSMSASENKIIKRVNSGETVLGRNTTPLVNIGKDVAVRVVRGTDGVVIVYSGSSGSVPTTELFRSEVADSASPTGKIGVGFEMGGGHISGINVVGRATTINIQPTPTPSATVSPSPSPSTGPAVPTITVDTTFSPNYSGQQGTPPSPTWSGSGFTLGTWNNYTFNATNGSLICDEYTWYGAIDYSFTQISINSCSSALLYFMYQDANNYYALEITSTGSAIIKVVNGVRTSLGSTTVKLYDNQISLRVIRQESGRISVWKGAKDSSTQTEYVFESTANDLTFNSGKIGMGYTGRTGGTQWVVNPKVKGTTNPGATPIPLATAVPATPATSAVSFDPTNTSVARKLGRAYLMNGVVNLGWSLSGLEFNATNAKDVYMQLKGNGMIGIMIDDQVEPIHTLVDSTNFTNPTYAKIASFSVAGNHKIRILKESPIANSIAISDIKVEGNTPNVFATAEKGRKIEFVGDSITVGSSMFPSGTVNERMGTNAILNYAGQTGLYFGADVSMTAVGGSGFAVDSKDSLSTFYYYDYCIQPKSAIISDDYKWDFNQYRPDIVIVNIGTNGDLNNTKEDYIQFYNQIRQRYNDTNKQIKILFALGAINQNAWPNIEAAYQELIQTDNNVYKLQLGSGYTSGVGSHPDLAQQTLMAQTLIAYLKQIMPGWSDADISAGAYQKTPNTVTVPYRVLKRVDTASTNVVMAALYDSKGKAVAVKTQNITFDTNNNSVNQSITFSGYNLSNTETYSAKLFLWNDKQGLKPLSKVEKVTLN